MPLRLLGLSAQYPPCTTSACSKLLPQPIVWDSPRVQKKRGNNNYSVVNYGYLCVNVKAGVIKQASRPNLSWQDFRCHPLHPDKILHQIMLMMVWNIYGFLVLRAADSAVPLLRLFLASPAGKARSCSWSGALASLIFSSGMLTISLYRIIKLQPPINLSSAL